MDRGPPRGSSSYSSYNGRDRAPRDRHSRRRPVADGPVLQGQVTSLKDAFGFLRRVDSPGDLFFHFSEAPSDVAVGTEVEFTLGHQPDGREVAMQLKALPEGTVEFERLIATGVLGIVKIEARRARQGRFPRDRPDEPKGMTDGVVELLHHLDGAAPPGADGEAAAAPGPPEAKAGGGAGGADGADGADKGVPERLPRVSYGAGDVEEQKRPLRRGDVVQMDVVVDLASGERRGRCVKFHCSGRDYRERAELDRLEGLDRRETGVISRMRSDHGFIDCCERVASMYFRADDADPRGVREGAEVSFLVLRGGPGEKPRACRLELLPEGTVKFEDILAQRVPARVVKAHKEPQTFRDDGGREGNRDGRAGLLQLCAPEGAAGEAPEGTAGESGGAEKMRSCNYNAGEMLSYSAGDLEAGLRGVSLRVGDRVLCDVAKRRADGVSLAKSVSLLSLNAGCRDEGVISALKEKDGYGFIRCATRNADVYFRINEVLGDKGAAAVGAGVAFDVTGDDRPKRGKGAKALRIEVLPEGTVWFEKVIAEDVSGTVVKEGAPERGGSFARHEGAVGGAVAPDAAPPELAFAERYPLLHGALEGGEDEVLFPSAMPKQRVDALRAHCAARGYELVNTKGTAICVRTAGAAAGGAAAPAGAPPAGPAEEGGPGPGGEGAPGKDDPEPSNGSQGPAKDDHEPSNGSQDPDIPTPKGDGEEGNGGGGSGRGDGAAAGPAAGPAAKDAAPLPFRAEDVDLSGAQSFAPRLEDRAVFDVVYDRRRDRLFAARVRGVVDPSRCEKALGIVTSLGARGGLVTLSDREERVRFRRASAGGALEEGELLSGANVEVVLGRRPTGGRSRYREALSVRVLPLGSVRLEEEMPGTFLGAVVALPGADRGGAGAKVGRLVLFGALEGAQLDWGALRTAKGGANNTTDWRGAREKKEEDAELKEDAIGAEESESENGGVEALQSLTFLPVVPEDGAEGDGLEGLSRGDAVCVTLRRKKAGKKARPRVCRMWRCSAEEMERCGGVKTLTGLVTGFCSQDEAVLLVDEEHVAAAGARELTFSTRFLPRSAGVPLHNTVSFVMVPTQTPEAFAVVSVQRLHAAAPPAAAPQERRGVNAGLKQLGGLRAGAGAVQKRMAQGPDGSSGFKPQHFRTRRAAEAPEEPAGGEERAEEGAEEARGGAEEAQE